MPLPRMSTRRWMIAVAVVAIALGLDRLYERRQRALAMARYHRSKEREQRLALVLPQYHAYLATLNPESAQSILRGRERQLKWHGELRRVYERAARYPWLLVAPDPPGPK
jgi:hypothetical protein